VPGRSHLVSCQRNQESEDVEDDEAEGHSSDESSSQTVLLI
jgi:hypothetical protein